jgi:Family of unknown function (DUF6325)
MEHGPVDVVLLAFGEPRFDGSVLSELGRLAGEGTIRVLDVMVVMKDEDGSVITLDIEDQPAEVKEVLGFIETGTRGMFDSDDADLLKEGIVPGSAVAALAVEHTWAIGLRKALEGAGGEVAMNFRIPGPMVDEALADLGVD